jgi:hypothetical protein
MSGVDPLRAAFDAGVNALRKAIIDASEDSNGAPLCVESGYWGNAKRWLLSLQPAYESNVVRFPVSDDPKTQAQLAAVLLLREAKQRDAINALLRKYGGSTHGPRVETVSIPQENFYRMMAEFKSINETR